MNKLKLLYDVVTTMKRKELLTGQIHIGVQKDLANVFSLQKDFTKNLATGQTQTKISTELDYEGKKFKHESNTEFIMPGHCHRGHHGFMRHMAMHQHPGGRCCGMKGKLSMLAFGLGLLNSLQISEQENGKAVVSLTAKEIPADLKEIFREKIEHAKTHLAAMPPNHGHHSCMKELLMLEACDFTLQMLVNDKREIETITVNLAGTQRDEQGQTHDVKAAAKLQLSW